MENWFKKEQLHLAAMNGDVGEIKRLLESGYLESINEFDEFALTPLIWAAKSGNIEAMKLLIAAGADINAHDEAKIGNTTISGVADEASYEMLQALIQAGANPNIRGWMQLNALDRAKTRKDANSKKIINLLESAARNFPET